MLAVLTVSPGSLSHPPSSQTLRTMAADHELVLVCGYDALPGFLGAVRALLPRHRLVALLVDGEPLRHERDLIEEILSVGHVPVVLTTGQPGAAHLSEWLNADTDLVLTPAAVAS
jgi:hypothetical protein